MAGLFHQAAHKAMQMSKKKPDPVRIQAGPFNIAIPMAGGGGLSSLKNNISIKGQPHELSYITPDEAAILKDLGGSGRMVNGIPAYAMDADIGSGWSDEAVDEGEPTGPGQGEKGHSISEEDEQGLFSTRLAEALGLPRGVGVITTGTRPASIEAAMKDKKGYITYGPEDDPLTHGYPLGPPSYRRRDPLLPKKYSDSELGPLEGLLYHTDVREEDIVDPILDEYKMKKRTLTPSEVSDVIDDSWKKGAAKQQKYFQDRLIKAQTEQREKNIDKLKYAAVLDETDPGQARLIREQVQYDIDKERLSRTEADKESLKFANMAEKAGLRTYLKGLRPDDKRRTPMATTKESREERSVTGSSTLDTSIRAFELMAKRNPNLTMAESLEKYNKERDTYSEVPLEKADMADKGYAWDNKGEPQIEITELNRLKQAVPVGLSALAGPLPLWAAARKLTDSPTLTEGLWKAGGNLVKSVSDSLFGKEDTVNIEKKVGDLRKTVQGIQKPVKLAREVMSPGGLTNLLKNKITDRAKNKFTNMIFGKTPTDVYGNRNVYNRREAPSADYIRNMASQGITVAPASPAISERPSDEYVRDREAYMEQFNVDPMEKMGLGRRSPPDPRIIIDEEEQEELIAQGWPRRRATGGEVLPDHDIGIFPPWIPDPYPEPPKPPFPDPPPPKPGPDPLPPDPPLPEPPPEPEDKRSAMEKYYNIDPEKDTWYTDKDRSPTTEYYKDYKIVNPNYTEHQLRILRKIYPGKFGDLMDRVG